MHMFKSKSVLMFVLKASLMYGLLAAPFSFYDIEYGKFYRVISGALFTTFHKIGYTAFTP